MNIRETAEFLEISESQVRNLMSRREIAHYRLAERTVRFDLADVQAYKQERDALRGASTSAIPTVNFLMRKIRNNASVRGLEVAITIRDVERIWLRAKGRCEVTGIEFSGEKIPGARMRPWIPSVDRIEIARGYVPDNIRLVCAYVNLVLYDYGEEAFAKLARAFLAKRSE